MDDVRQLTLTVNGEVVSRSVPVRLNLVDFLRHELGLTGSHVGCEQGVCGACTIRLDGRIVRGCLMLAVQAEGADVATIEGVSDAGELTSLQAEFHARNALQCGFCTPGILLTAHELIQQHGSLTRDDVRRHLSGNICRCTGYQTIVDAVMAAVGQEHDSRPKLQEDGS